jgi:phosphate transport system substrate-binding protein
MLKQNAFILTAILLLVIASGCVGTQQEGSNKIVIAGSGSSISILNLIVDSFESSNKGITPEFLPSTGTGDGVIGVAEGMLNIGAAARKMKDSEKEKYPDLMEVTFLRDAMVLAVNKNVQVDGLTSEQIRKIHSGEITNWNEVGGQDAEIVVLDREESESSKILLREHIFGPDMNITSSAILMHSADSMDQGIEQMPNSIGQTSLGMIKAKGLTIKALAVDGVQPSVSTVRDGSYKMVRDYGVIYGKNATGTTNTFVDFLFSEEAGEILEGYGFAPVSRGTS